MERPTLYLCDPEKNTECRKTSCVHKPVAVGPLCRTTKHPEFAKLDEDGDPIRAINLRYPLQEEEELRGKYQPYKLRLDISSATVWAKYAFLLALFSLILSATALFLK